MPDTLNKQAIINLLIDSPLREPIKINLIDIVNNTGEPDLPKVYSTITKELEIFQKATERRMKLADETIAKLGGTATPAAPTPAVAPQTPASPVAPVMSAPTPSLPPLDLPPLPQPPVMTQTPVTPPAPVMPPAFEPSLPPLSVPPLDLPPMPQMPSTPEPVMATEPVPSALPTPQPLGGMPAATTSDEDALAEIQKELDSLKSATAAEIKPPAPTAPAPVQQ